MPEKFDDDDSLIIRYFDNQASKEEKELVERKLANDDAFLKKFDQQIEFQNDIRSALELEKKKGKKKKGFVLQPIQVIMAVAASIILVLLFMFSQSETNASDLTATIVENSDRMEFAYNPTIRSMTQNLNLLEPVTNILLIQIDSLYKIDTPESDEAAISLIGNIKDETAKNELLIYAGVMHFDNKEYDEAVKVFDHLINIEHHYQYHAMWYKSLLLLDQGNMSEAKLLLQQVASNPKDVKTQEAKEILSLLND